MAKISRKELNKENHYDTIFNIRSREELTAETSEQIAALWASSDHSPNITQGQDFGWRMAPSVVVEMKSIKQDPEILEKIARRIKKEVEELKEYDILEYISAKTAAANAPVATEGDYTDEYDAEVRRLMAKRLSENETAPVNEAPQQESLADLEKRVELEERLARAKAANEAPAPTTTTTTAAPATTTTTTTKGTK